jgi:signal transduction histidine kinase
MFYFLYNVEKERTIEQLNERQLIHAKQAAKGLEDYIESWVKRLVLLSKNESIVKLTPSGKKLADDFFEEQKNQIGSLIRTDKKGIIIYAPQNLNLTGKDISYEKHVKDILANHKSIVSDIFYAVQGYNAIAIHVPVYDNDGFVGSLGAILKVEAAGKRFLDDIKIGENGYAWMISKDGIELYNPIEGHTGKSIYETSLEFPSLLDMGKRMMAGETGYTTFYYNQSRSKNTELTKRYGIYTPVHIYNTYWSIGVASPENEVLTSLINYRNNLLLIIVGLFIGATIFAYYGMKTFGIIKESNAREKAELLLQKLNSELESKVAERTNQLKETNQDLERFNYTVSHDLRAPLRAINGFVEALPDENDGPLSDEAQNLLKRIKRAAEKMDTIIESMLKLSRLNYHSLDITDLNISAMTRSIAKEMQSYYPEVLYEIKVEDALRASGDYELIILLLENLLSNAFKFSSKTDKPVIQLFRTEKEGKNVFCITDNGAGFVGEKDSKLFTPFKRFHSDYEFVGIGIGLAIVKKIIDMHHGKIWVESSPGNGASFYFYLDAE